MAGQSESLSNLVKKAPPWAVPAVVGVGIGGVVLLLRLRNRPTGTAPVAEAAAPPPPPTSGGGGLALAAADDNARSLVDTLRSEQAAALAAERDRVEQALAQQSTDILGRFGTVGDELARLGQSGSAADDQLKARLDAINAQIAALLAGQKPPVDPVIPAPTQPAPTQPAPGGGGAAEEWRKYAANAGLLKWNVDQKRQLPAGEPLWVYAGAERKSAMVIHLPKAYDGRADTKRFPFGTTINEPLLVRAARKTADDMARNPGLNAQSVMLGYLRSESRALGGWQGTGFTAGPADVAAGYP